MRENQEPTIAADSVLRDGSIVHRNRQKSINGTVNHDSIAYLGFRNDRMINGDR
jgi:hypothetical protein